MSARLARLALAFYPLAYRRRYGEEMAALVEDVGTSPAAVADLLRGAARAHLRPPPGMGQELGPEDRLRLGLSSILLCWVVFSVAGIALYKTTEDHAFTTAAGAHGLLGAAHLAVQLLALVATAAVALGATPLIVIALRQARDRRAVERATVLATGCVLLFVLATAALVVVANLRPAHGDVDAAAGLAIWTGVALACGIGCAVAGRLGLFAITVPRDILRASAACALVVVLGMVGIALATAVCLVALLHDAPGLAGQGNGPLELVSVAASLGIQLAVMLAVAAPAALSATRAWRRPAAG
ncbi:MAG TPA: hypothetical protein VHE08_04515 [Solirubrobacterales bacterium]|nr:hypothetical protein [Solirubrobacterales bacterium]